MALGPGRINEIHRLVRGGKWSIRKVARRLKLSRQTVRKYLQRPWSLKARAGGRGAGRGRGNPPHLAPPQLLPAAHAQEPGSPSAASRA